MIATRKVREELEAKLTPTAETGGGRGSGKLEWKRYGDGSSGLKLRARGLDCPDGAELALAVGNEFETALPVARGKAELRLDSREGAAVPPLREYDQVELRFEGKALLRGILAPD